MSPFRIPPIPTAPLSQVYPWSSGSDHRTRGHAGPRVPPTQLHPTRPPFPALPLPSLSTATKAEQYTRVVAFDRRALKRHKAHQRNAMKTTENLEQVFRELNEVCTFQINFVIYNALHFPGCILPQSLESLEGCDKVMSFERLSAYADAFQELVQISGVFAPLLQRIKVHSCIDYCPAEAFFPAGASFSG